MIFATGLLVLKATIVHTSYVNEMFGTVLFTNAHPALLQEVSWGAVGGRD